MSTLELRFLGDFAVLRDGSPQPLPPSRKTRALLAFLALNPRPFRRERLCELLWEVPDDPRGSLRWSLSKLRRLVDDPDRRRIVADRSQVRVDGDEVSIDVIELRELVAGDLDAAPADSLEAAVARFRGNFLEDLDFPNFHDFHAWCVAEREQALRDRMELLEALLRRLADDPQRALPHARALVGLSPYDESARSRLIRLLHAARQTNEAEEQFRLGLRMLEEAGVQSTGELAAARRARGPDPVAASVPVTPPAQARSPRRRSDLVGRDEEIAQIVDTFERTATRGMAGLTLLHGPPGIGKTRILGGLSDLAREREIFLLQAVAFESDAIRPFALWIDALRTLGGDLEQRVFAQRENGDRDRLFAALNEFVQQRSAQGPVVMIFDDAHWCDESSAAALHYILRMNRNRPVLGVVAARTGELRDNAHMQQALRGLRRDGLLRELPLGPLSHRQVQRLIADQAPEVDAERLSRECGGNPLLAIELARAESEGTGAASLGDLVRERLERFDDAGAEILRWASILAPPFDLDDLGQVTGFDAATIGAVVERAEQQGLLVQAERSLRFSHHLIGKAVYSDISPLRRQVMHRRIAESLERSEASPVRDHASWLAHHATLSGDPGLAARSMVVAGRLCLRFFANEEAASLARKGLQFATHLNEAERVAVEIELHEVLLSAEPLGDRSAAAERYAALAERALDHGDLDHARLGYHLAATVRWNQGEWDAAREQSLQAARVIRSEDSKAHIIGMAETAKCLILLERDLSQADAMLMETRALAERRRLSHPAIAAAMGLLRLHENRLEEAWEALQQSRALCKSSGDRLNEFLACEYLVAIELQRRDYASARQGAEQLLELGEKLREGSERPFAVALLALCDYALEDDDANLDAALDELRMVDAKYRLAFVLTRAALIDCQRGRKQAAVARAEEALECAKILERPTEMLLAHAVLACGHGTMSTEQAEHHEQAVRELMPMAAAWTADIVSQLAAPRAQSAS